MKSRIKAAIASSAMLVIFAFSGCSKGEESFSGDVSVTVTFDLDYADAATIPSVSVSKGAAAAGSWPANPARLGYDFDGWYAGGALYTKDTPINNDVTVKAKWKIAESLLEDQPAGNELAALFTNNFPSALSNSWKIWNHRNPLITQSFSADPSTIVYNDRAYLFSSNDSIQYNTDGTVKNNGDNYNTGIQGLRVSSSADLANWTDHGLINVTGTANTNPLIDKTAWDASRLINKPGINASWAPSAAWKMINGKPKFFIYWCNTGDGIGVITADSPTGPWTAPLDGLLIDRDTPNCRDVIWLFDPGVFIDDDGSAYLYFGGGTEGLTDMNNTGQARRVKLGADMLSLDGEPETWNVPYLFEACDMFKYRGKYYLSYCTNWNTGGNAFGLSNSQIAYMMGYEPLGTFSDPKPILTSASNQLASFDSNNHQNIFVFKGEVYIAYHTQKPVEAMGLPRGQHGYRSTSIDKVTVNNDGTLAPVTMTRKGIEQVGNLNPYIPNEAETIGIQGGIYTRPDPGASNGTVVTSIDTGDWVAVYGVDFGSDGAKKFAVRVRMPDTAGYTGAIELRLDPAGDGITADNGNLSAANTARIKGGEVIGRVQLKAKPGEEGKYTFTAIDLDNTVIGVHDLVFVFYSSLGVKVETVAPDTRHKNGFEFDQWQFFK